MEEIKGRLLLFFHMTPFLCFTAPRYNFGRFRRCLWAVQIYDGRGGGGGRAVELALFSFFFYDGHGRIAESRPPLVKEMAERRPNHTGGSGGAGCRTGGGRG